MRPDVLLATLDPKPAHYAATAAEHAAVAPNLHLGMLAVWLRAHGCEVHTLDAELEGLDHAGLAARVVALRPRLLLLVCSGANPSSSTMIMALAVDFFARAWRPLAGTLTALWGPHPTVLPERSLRETGVDLVVRGEGFHTLPALLADLRAGREPRGAPGLSWIEPDGSMGQTPDAPLLEDLDAIPSLDWERDLPPARFRCHNWHAFGRLGERSPYAIVWTSLGCPFRCTFCAVNNLFPGPRRQRFRGIERVVRELVHLRRVHGVRSVRIFDELFVTRRERIEAFCDGLRDAGVTDLHMWCYARLDTVDPDLLRRLAAVGLAWISYGFESPSPRVLAGVAKGARADPEEVIRATREAGLAICADVMFGIPGEDAEDMRATLAFCERHDFEWVNMYPCFAYPGTALFDPARAPASWHAYSLYGPDCSPMGTEHLSPAEVLAFRDRAFVRYHGRPSYLARIEGRFGPDTRAHVERMVARPLRRRLLEGG